MSNTMNSRELAALYGMTRDATEIVLSKIKPKRYGTTETLYDPVEVADLLAAQDAQAEQEIVKVLDAIQNDELAEQVLIQGIKDGHTLLQIDFRGENQAKVDNAKHAIAGEVVARLPFATRRLRQEWQKAGSGGREADLEWQLLEAFQVFRDRLVQAFRARRAAAK